MKININMAKIKKYQKPLAWTAGVVLLGWGVLSFIFSQEVSGVKEAAAQVEQLAVNIRRHYQNRPDYWGLGTQTVIDKKIAPRQMLQNGHLVGFMGNPVLVGLGADGTILMPGSRNFDIIYKDLSAKQCVALASYKFEQKFWLGVTGITIINAKQTQDFSWDSEAYKLPVIKSLAKEFCHGNATIIWHFD